MKLAIIIINSYLMNSQFVEFAELITPFVLRNNGILTLCFLKVPATQNKRNRRFKTICAGCALEGKAQIDN